MGPRAGKKQGTGKNPASVAVIGRLPGFCSHSSSISSFRGHLMTAQTGYFSCPHIAIDLEKVNWCPTEISRNWLNMQQLWWMVLGAKNQCYSTDNFNRNLMIFTRNHPNALEVHWSYAITFNKLLIRAHIWIKHKISMLFFKHGKKLYWKFILFYLGRCDSSLPLPFPSFVLMPFIIRMPMQ